MRRPEDIKEQLGNIEQIESVVVAMRALAVAHVSEARKHLTAIHAQQATVMRAMASALTLLPVPEPVAAQTTATQGATLWIVFGAAQGFSGPYSGKIVAAALEKGLANSFMVIGQRGISECAARGLTPVWSAEMVAHCDEVPNLASRLSDALFMQINSRAIRKVGILRADPDSGDPVSIPLMPFDFSRVPHLVQPEPLITLPPQALLASLVEEYIFTALCEGLMLGFAAENTARMAAMTRARSNVQTIRDDLRREFAQARQDQMTNEILELIGQGRDDGGPKSGRRKGRINAT